MRQFTINIGLHNNPLAVKETNEELIKQGKEYSDCQTLIYTALCLAFDNVYINYKIAKGSWVGADEPTFVTTIEVDYSSFVFGKIELLCMMMTQICIPYSSTEESHLVYSPLVDYPPHERYKFDPEFFINH